ncbi:MAG: hypothetical protein M1828_003591 [Chrysothrix sp. TS-e1954]|nr:MAG: hypothetical protein M1828_003591 [Chrysothrix sp. TS-e1954]
MSFLYFLALAMFTVAEAQYSLVDDFSGASFFDNFAFFTDGDPTHGYVQFVDEGTAQNNGLINTKNNQAYMGVDYTSTLDPNGVGRQSVRLTSNKAYTEGLFILDAAHMPGGICGTWPAWWTVGGNWPNNGEIDIIEQVNSAATDLSSLHTSDSCSIAGSGQTGTVITGDCYQYDPAQSNSGCGIANYDASSYGTAFNANGGGVYAMEWTASWIRVYFFPRTAIPGDITSGAPSPAGWGEPVANFQGNCDIPSHFASHNIVFDTTFCGDWGSPAFSSDATCSARAATCNDYVAGSPAAFTDAYWTINSVKVYEASSANAALQPEVEGEPQPSTTLKTVTPVASTGVPGHGLEFVKAPGATGEAAPAGVVSGKSGSTKSLQQSPTAAA